MTQTTRLRLVIVFAVLAVTVSVAIAGFAFRRAAALQSLRLDTDTTLQSVYRLSNQTYSLLYAAADLREAATTWEAEFDNAFTALDQLAFHPALPLLGRDIELQVRQTRSLWSVNTNGFVAGGARLSQVLENELPADLPGNLSDAIQDLADEDQQQELLFDFRRALFEIDATNQQFGFFTTSALTSLAEQIQAEAEGAIRATAITAGVSAVLLLVLVLFALITALRLLQSSNSRLEQRVRERTRSIQSLLDFSGEGFLSFGPDRIIRPELSRECDTIFGQSVVGREISSVLFTDRQKREDFASAMELVFSGATDPEVVFDVLDDRLEIQGKTIDMDLRVVDEQTVMCALRDVTEQQRMQREFEDQQKKREMVLRVVTARPHFMALLDEADSLMERLVAFSSQDSFEELIRELHTFKSNAAFLKMHDTSAAAHELETALTDAEVLGDMDPVSPALREFQNAYRREIAFVTESLGSRWVDNRSLQEVDGTALQRVYRQVVVNHGEDTELVGEIDRLSRIPLESLFSRMEELVSILASSRGKYVAVVAEAQELAVHTGVYNALSDALNHLIRNMVDHGIERPGDRQRAGKESTGTIELKAERLDGRLRITVADDGAGIDLEAVVNRAKEHGLISAGETPRPEAIARAVFSDGLSTAATVSATSGRGAGLSAVRHRIRSIGGQINLSTRRGRGTTFTLSIPDLEGAS